MTALWNPCCDVHHTAALTMCRTIGGPMEERVIATHQAVTDSDYTFGTLICQPACGTCDVQSKNTLLVPASIENGRVNGSQAIRRRVRLGGFKIKEGSPCPRSL